MTVVIMKTHCAKQVPNILEYKIISNYLFTNELEQNLWPGLDKTIKCKNHSSWEKRGYF